MATKEEIFNLMQSYTNFDEMLIAAIQAGNTSEARDIELQMGKLREKLASMGQLAQPSQNEQPS
jgi:hypothetical protein